MLEISHMQPLPRSCERIRTALVACTLIALSGCDVFAPGGSSFPWLEPGNTLTYDYRAVSEPVLNEITGEEVWYVPNDLELRIELYLNENLQIVDYISANGILVPRLPSLGGLLRSFSGIERARDGLRVRYPEDCEGGLLKETFTAVRVPARPRLGERYYSYRCRRDVIGTHEVVAVDTIITVPAGTFETFVIYDIRWQQRHYWDEQEGFIKAEYLNEDGSVRGAHELASRNY